MNDGAFEINGMTAADVPAILSLQKACKLSAWSKNGYLNELKNPESICLVASIESQIVGFLIASILNNQICEIYNLGRDPKFRNNAIGGLLITEIKELCLKRSVFEILLEVRESNTSAIDFYLSHKFIQIGLQKDFYTNPNENALTMYAQLNKH